MTHIAIPQETRVLENSLPGNWLWQQYYHLLGCRIFLRANCLEFAGLLRHFMRSFPAVAGPDPALPGLNLSFEVDSPACSGPETLHAIYRDQEQVGATTSFWHLLRLFEWQLDIFLSNAVQDYYLLHAAALVHKNQGIIVPGVSGNGKSSLALALFLQGYGYLSDELAVIEPDTARLRGYPKPFSLKTPSLFPNLAARKNIWVGPEMDSVVPPGAIPVWYVHPEDVRPAAVARGPVPIRTIIFPHYNPNAIPELRPIPAGQAMRGLLENSVNFSQLGRGGLRLLARLVQEARSYAVTVNGPEATARLVAGLIG